MMSSNNQNNNVTLKNIRLTEMEALLVGAIGGTTETTIQMPLIIWKICSQEGRAYPTVLREWYRGCLINASSLAPITATQCFANQLFQSTLLSFDQHSETLSETEQIACSASAGAISAFIYGPVDLMVIHQSKLSASLSSTFQFIRGKYGILKVYRGLASTMIRESIYTVGYLGLAPVIQNRLENIQTTDFWRTNYVLTSVVSAMMGGTVASVLTHPVDVCKTCVQSDLDAATYVNARSTAVYLYGKGGISVLFKGLLPRTLRLCGACFVISQVRQIMKRIKLNGMTTDE